MTTNQLQKHLAALDRGDDQIQRQALQALRGLEPKDWNEVPRTLIPVCLGAFHRQLLRENKQVAIHKDIAAILASMGTLSKNAVPELSDLLRDGVPDCVREAAAGALGKLGSEAKNAVPRLTELAAVPSSLAKHAVGALGDIGHVDQRVRGALINLWHAPAHSHDGAVQLAITLCKLQVPADGAGLFLTNTLFDNQTETTRIAAAEGLSWCGKNDPDVVPALLLAHVSDKSERVREAAKAAYLRLCVSDANAIQVCAAQLKESKHAEAALRKTGATTIPALIDALGASNAAVRLKAMRILSGFGELAVAAVKELTKALRDNDPEIRLASAKCLWNVAKNADAVVPVLVNLLTDRQADRMEDENRRMYLQTVIEALSRIGPPASAAVPALTAKVKDKNRLVSQSASEALKKIQPGGVK